MVVSDLHAEAYARGWRTGFRDSRSAVRIEMKPRSAEEIIRAFYSAGFECLTHLPLCLGEPEKPIFARAGKGHLFTRACQVPAVLVCHFRRSTQIRVARWVVRTPVVAVERPDRFSAEGRFF